MLQMVATACLFLACKVEECLRRVQKVLESCYSVRYRMDLIAVQQVFSNNPVSLPSNQPHGLILWHAPSITDLLLFIPAVNV